jgi:hypothetical protein
MPSVLVLLLLPPFLLLSLVALEWLVSAKALPLLPPLLLLMLLSP